VLHTTGFISGRLDRTRITQCVSGSEARRPEKTVHFEALYSQFEGSVERRVAALMERPPGRNQVALDAPCRHDAQLFLGRHL
jgi:hypothetical protein